MMLRSVIVLLLALNLLVLSWTAGVFSRWGWGPAQNHPETRAESPMAADALKLLEVQSTVSATPALPSTPSSSSVQ